MGACNPSTRAAEIGTVLDLVEPVNFRLSETLPQKLSFHFKWKIQQVLALSMPGFLAQARVCMP